MVGAFVEVGIGGLYSRLMSTGADPHVGTWVWSPPLDLENFLDAYGA